MQFLDDDIDQLFRRASEEYPLNTNSADWDKVARALNEEKPAKRNKFRKYISWLIPLTFFWLINTYVGHVEHSNSTVQNRTKGSNKNNLSNISTIKSNTSVNQNNTSITGATDQLQVAKPNTSAALDNNIPTQLTQNNSSVDRIPFSATSSMNQSISFSTPFTAQRLAIVKLEQNNYPLPSISASYAVNKYKFKFANSIKPKAKDVPSSSLYMGLIGGIDISTVKFQDVSKVGYTAGALVGFAFNKRWSVESGAYYDQKSYYSDGKYFDPKLYPNLIINTVDGTCHMIEIPVSVRYNFKKRENTWFASAGLSSYLMKKENYNFEYTYPPSTNSYYYYKEFKNSTKNWFSILNISVGYSKKIGNIGDLRIEPYIKAPLKGLGIGKLPFSSTGINVGITHKLF